MRCARVVAGWLLLAWLAACDPSHPCDPGYYADHGMCLRVVMKTDAGSETDSGAPSSRPDANFGDACTTAADCGGRAPVCGAPMLPVCTVVNCLQNNIECPPGWNCFDVTAWTTDPSVKSVCVNVK